jgi:hypothetical protein
VPSRPTDLGPRAGRRSGSGGRLIRRRTRGRHQPRTVGNSSVSEASPPPSMWAARPPATGPPAVVAPRLTAVAGQSSRRRDNSHRQSVMQADRAPAARGRRGAVGSRWGRAGPVMRLERPYGPGSPRPPARKETRTHRLRDHRRDGTRDDSLNELPTRPAASRLRAGGDLLWAALGRRERLTASMGGRSSRGRRAPRIRPCVEALIISACRRRSSPGVTVGRLRLAARMRSAAASHSGGDQSLRREAAEDRVTTRRRHRHPTRRCRPR